MLKHTIKLSVVEQYLPKVLADLTMSYVSDSKEIERLEKGELEIIKHNDEIIQTILEDKKILDLIKNQSLYDYENMIIKNNIHIFYRNTTNNEQSLILYDEDAINDDWGDPEKNDELDWE